MSRSLSSSLLEHHRGTTTTDNKRQKKKKKRTPDTTSIAAFLPRAIRVYIRLRWYRFCRIMTTPCAADQRSSRVRKTRTAGESIGSESTSAAVAADHAWCEIHHERMLEPLATRICSRSASAT